MDQNWSYGGEEYPFDISDAECLERIGKIFAILKNDDNTDGGLTPAEKAIEVCESIRSFFSALFGDEKSLEICGQKQSAARCTEAYLDFIEFLKVQIDEFSRLRQAVEERYSKRAASLASVADETA